MKKKKTVIDYSCFCCCGVFSVVTHGSEDRLVFSVMSCECFMNVERP